MKLHLLTPLMFVLGSASLFGAELKYENGCSTTSMNGFSGSFATIDKDNAASIDGAGYMNGSSIPWGNSSIGASLNSTSSAFALTFCFSIEQFNSGSGDGSLLMTNKNSGNSLKLGFTNVSEDFSSAKLMFSKTNVGGGIANSQTINAGDWYQVTLFQLTTGNVQLIVTDLNSDDLIATTYNLGINTGSVAWNNLQFFQGNGLSNQKGWLDNIKLYSLDGSDTAETVAGLSATNATNAHQYLSVPEPTTVTLSLLGLGVLMVRRRRNS